MRNKIIAPLMAFVMVLFAGAMASAEDDRQLIEVDETLKATLLKEMRVLTERLDDVLAALSEGDFKEVARIGEIHLGFGHKKLEAMLAAGATDEQIKAMRERMKLMRKMREDAGIDWHGKGGGLFGLGGYTGGLGHKMPKDFWLMGQSMHGSAEEMAVAARKAGDKPGVESYMEVLGHLQGMTATCRACHNAFRVQ